MSGAIPRQTRKHVVPSSKIRQPFQATNVNQKNSISSSTPPHQRLDTSYTGRMGKNIDGKLRPENDVHGIGKQKYHSKLTM